MPLDAIGAFEEANSIAVNVYELDSEDCVFIKRASTLTAKADEHVDLLYIEKDGQSHYCLITDLQKLLRLCSAPTSTFAKLPDWVQAKTACVNPQCKLSLVPVD